MAHRRPAETRHLRHRRHQGPERQSPRPARRDAEIADAAIDFIRTNKAGPFYVNVWFHTPHFPVDPPKSFADRFKDVTVSRADFPNPDSLAHFAKYEKLGGNLETGMRNFLGDVSQLDDQVARVLKAIDELDLRQNTIVVFSSDNGPARCADGASAKAQARLKVNMLGTAGPLRERKFSLHDGGIRLPFIVRWPGHVTAGRTDDRSVIAGVDWLPSLCSITGAKIDATKLDGEDVSDIWLGRERARVKDLFWKISRPKSPVAMRRGNWKAYMEPREPVELYDLTTDRGERTDVAAAQPIVVRELGAALKKWNAMLPAKYQKGVADDQ